MKHLGDKFAMAEGPSDYSKVSVAGGGIKVPNKIKQNLKALEMNQYLIVYLGNLQTRSVFDPIDLILRSSKQAL